MGRERFFVTTSKFHILLRLEGEEETSTLFGV